MNDFKKRPLKRGPSPSEQEIMQTQREAERMEQKAQGFGHQFKDKTWSQIVIESFQKHYVWGTILMVAIVALGKMTWNVATLAEDFTPKEIILAAFSEKVKTDRDDHTNILLLGTGTETHDGGNLTDTIIVASIDHDNDLVSMLSIPRDLYVQIPELYGGNRINTVLELVAEQEIYKNKTEENEAYRIGYNVLMRTIENMLDIELHYYARVDFDGFIEMVDAIDGIDIYVDETLYDPFYPAEDGIHDYAPFAIQAGVQHLDGDRALRFVRSRKTTSDFDRAARQQKVLEAIKDKALSLGILGNPGRLKNLYDAFQSNFDTNLNWSEITYLAKISSNFDRENLKTWVLNDNPLTEGGLLYTPDRELYQGAFVLVPFVQDNSDLKRFAQIVLKNQTAHKTPLTYQILNGTGANGLATETMYYLGRFGFNVIRYGNAVVVPVETTRIIPRTALLAGQDAKDAQKHPELKILRDTLIPVGEFADILPPEYSPAEWDTQADVIIELGQDFTEWMKKNRKYFY